MSKSSKWGGGSRTIKSIFAWSCLSYTCSNWHRFPLKLQIPSKSDLKLVEELHPKLGRNVEYEDETYLGEISCFLNHDQRRLGLLAGAKYAGKKEKET